MKISATQENLNQGLFVVSHIASKNTALPILNNVLIKASENSINLSATNLEIGINCEIRGKVDKPGEFTVQSRLLADFISLLPKDRVDLEVIKDAREELNQIFSISCKNHSTKIKGQPSTDFPVIPKIEKKDGYTVNCQNLRQAIGQVLLAVSTSETRPEISGVLFNFNKDKMILAATDSYRLAEKIISLNKKSCAKSQQVIVPAKTLQELQRILGSFKDPAAISEIENIQIYVAENQILFVLDSIELISRLVEGQYPDYRQIIPQQSNTQVKVSTTDLINATKANSLFARSGIYDVNLEFVADKKEMVVSSANNQLGENISRLSAEISGQNNNIVVNFRYLLDGLQNMDTDSVEIEMIDSSSPCVIKPASKDDDYLYIIMPIKQ